MTPTTEQLRAAARAVNDEFGHDAIPPTFLARIAHVAVKAAFDAAGRDGWVLLDAAPHAPERADDGA